MAIRFHKHLFSGAGNRNVWAAVQLHGLSNFAFLVVGSIPQVVSNDDNRDLLNMEDSYITALLPVYNVAPQAGNTFGYKHSDEVKAQMRVNYSSERREAIGALNRGKSFSDSTIEKIREAALNRSPMSDATRDKVSSNSAKAELFGVSRVDGASFTDADGQTVTSTVVRTILGVGLFVKCDEKTVRRALAASGVVKRTWKVVRLGKANTGK